MNYFQKYIKYKNKYLKLRENYNILLGGTNKIDFDITHVYNDQDKYISKQKLIFKKFIFTFILRIIFL